MLVWIRFVSGERIDVLAAVGPARDARPWRRRGCLVARAVGARADMLHATYNVSLIGLPIGVANVNADAHAEQLCDRRHGQAFRPRRRCSPARAAPRRVKGAIVDNHVVPATFATTASNASMTRTIRMSLAANAVTGVDISPPFEDKPDRIPLSDKRQARDRRSRRRLRHPRPAQGAARRTGLVRPHDSRSSTAIPASTSI